jgi:hypothetical protein
LLKASSLFLNFSASGFMLVEEINGRLTIY